MKRIFNRIINVLMEGFFLRRVREEIDELIARVARFITLHTTKTIPNKVFFHTQEDKYTCNPKYICEELRKRNLDVDIVWRVNKNNRGSIPLDVRVVENGTANYFREIFSSKYIITNSVLFVRRAFSLKKDQVLFETWHGSLGFKRFGKNDYKAGWHWVQGAIKTGKMTSYCITNSSFVSEQLRKTYWPNTPMLEYGHPRNDIMFDTYKEKREEIKKAFLKQYGLKADTKFVLYGPTFRDSKSFDVYTIDAQGTIDACKKRFGGNWVLLLRYHSAVAAVFEKRNQISGENIVSVTDYDDMQELITIADVAITDYSSWILDFVLQRRPGFIFATDLKDYNNERGLCYPLEEAPFPIASSAKQLIDNILNFDEEKYLNDVEQFLIGKGCIEDGHASERVVDKIIELMNQNK